jgi:transcriptional regulator with XRE-family HTH domain
VTLVEGEATTMSETIASDASPSDAEERWERFAKWLTDARAMLGLTRSEFSRQVGVSFQTVTHLETVHRMVSGSYRLPNPDDRTMFKLAQGLTRLGRPTQPEELFTMIGGRARERAPVGPLDEEATRRRAGTDARLRRLEEQHEQAMAELARLRRLVEGQPGEADQPGPVPVPDPEAQPRRRAGS